MSLAPTAAALQRSFDAPGPATIGLEDEVWLLDADTLDLLPAAADVLARTSTDTSVKGELPASQLECITTPCATVAEASKVLHAGRRRLVAAAQGIGVLAAVGAHPFAVAEGLLSSDEPYKATLAEYGRLARLQMVSGLHVHVAVRPARRALAVYNAMRSYLPELAALGANSPFHAGADTGLASVRPKLAEALPRQGVPPPFASFDELAATFEWGLRAGALSTPRRWWWELRLHPFLGTLEVRVFDAQHTVRETSALAAVVHALALWLAERYDDSDLPPPAPTWRIEENRWSACRYGVRGVMADLQTGARQATADRLAGLLADLRPAAARLSCGRELAAAEAILQEPAPERHRAIVREVGLHGLAAWLSGRFLDGAEG